MAADSAVQVVRAAERSTETQQTSGMTREVAVASDRVWAAYVRAAPETSSGWHHHGDYETIVYVVSGRLRFDFGKGGAGSIEAAAGDFVRVPPGAVHRESNPERTEGAVVVVRAGAGVPNVNVEGPVE